MEKESYFVNLNPISMDAISPIKVHDGKLIEYEISVTPSEKRSLETLLSKVKEHDLELGSLFTFKHFKNKSRALEKDKYQSGLNKIYEEIHRLGTDETKQQIEEINLINNDH